MEPEVQSNRPQVKKRNIVLIILAVFIVLMLTSSAAFAYMTLQYGDVYRGVSVGNLNASGMSMAELKKALDEKVQSVSDKQEITLRTERAEAKSGFSELEIRYDTETAARNAFAIGRSGSIFDRLYDIAHAGLSGISLKLPQTSNKEKVEKFVNDFYNKTLINVNDGALYITETAVTIRSGNHGENIDREKTLKLVNELICEGRSGTVEPEVIITPPSRFDVDELYKQINSEPADAAYKVENLTAVLEPHKIGRKIDRSQLENIVAELENTENTERILPITFTYPKITSEMATAMLFKDELASSHTSFATGTTNGINRGFNMGIAVSKINGLILAPGQEFSYNDVVGPRDQAHGFKVAHVYSAGKIIDGIGGGICQVSSTMYLSVLRADLEVAERRNHSFTVNYVPLGQDATAYYGGTDFRFKNSTKWPIKLLASVKGNKVYFSIMGTNDTPDKTVIISSKILKETPFTVKYKDDPTLPVGTEKEVLPGMNGYVVETYKTIKTGDTVVSQTKLHTSVYKVYDQEMLRGTKPVAGKPGIAAPVTPGSTVPGNTQTPSKVIEPVEDVEDEASQPPVDVTNDAGKPAAGGTNSAGTRTAPETLPAQ